MITRSSQLYLWVCVVIVWIVATPLGTAYGSAQTAGWDADNTIDLRDHYPHLDIQVISNITAFIGGYLPTTCSKRPLRYELRLAVAKLIVAEFEYEDADCESYHISFPHVSYYVIDLDDRDSSLSSSNYFSYVSGCYHRDISVASGGLHTVRDNDGNGGCSLEVDTISGEVDIQDIGNDAWFHLYGPNPKNLPEYPNDSAKISLDAATPAY